MLISRAYIKKKNTERIDQPQPLITYEFLSIFLCSQRSKCGGTQKAKMTQISQTSAKT